MADTRISLDTETVLNVFNSIQNDLVELKPILDSLETDLKDEAKKCNLPFLNKASTYVDKMVTKVVEGIKVLEDSTQEVRSYDNTMSDYAADLSVQDID